METFYVVILFDSEGNFDPDYNDIVAPFASRDAAKHWADQHVPGRTYCVVETTSPLVYA